MNIKIKLIVFVLASCLSLPAFAYETWHTIGGKSYDVYAVERITKKGNNASFHIISYRTKQKLNDRYSLLQENYDLITHYCTFLLNKKLKNDMRSIITIEAFNTLPKNKKERTPSHRFTKKFSEIKKIVQSYHDLHKNRRKAFELFDNGKFNDAIITFKKIKKKVAHDHIQIANAYLYSNRRDDALNHLKKALKIYPKHAVLLNNYAMTNLMLGTFIFSGKYEYDLDKANEAKKTLAKSLNLDASNALTLSNMALVEVALKQPKKAEAFYLKALNINKGSPRLAFDVASFYHHQKSFQKAQRYYDQSLRLSRNVRSPAASDQQKLIKKRLQRVAKKKLPKN